MKKLSGKEVFKKILKIIIVIAGSAYDYEKCREPECVDGYLLIGTKAAYKWLSSNHSICKEGTYYRIRLTDDIVLKDND